MVPPCNSIFIEVYEVQIPWNRMLQKLWGNFLKLFYCGKILWRKSNIKDGHFEKKKKTCLVDFLNMLISYLTILYSIFIISHPKILFLLSTTFIHIQFFIPLLLSFNLSVNLSPFFIVDQSFLSVEATLECDLYIIGYTIKRHWWYIVQRIP